MLQRSQGAAIGPKFLRQIGKMALAGEVMPQPGFPGRLKFAPMACAASGGSHGKAMLRCSGVLNAYSRTGQ
jgi:hypothetical protein